MANTEKEIIKAIDPCDKVIGKDDNIVNLNEITPVLKVNPDAATINALPNGALWVETT